MCTQGLMMKWIIFPITCFQLSNHFSRKSSGLGLLRWKHCLIFFCVDVSCDINQKWEIIQNSNAELFPIHERASFVHVTKYLKWLKALLCWSSLPFHTDTNDPQRVYKIDFTRFSKENELVLRQETNLFCCYLAKVTRLSYKHLRLLTRLRTAQFFHCYKSCRATSEEVNGGSYVVYTVWQSNYSYWHFSHPKSPLVVQRKRIKIYVLNLEK